MHNKILHRFFSNNKALLSRKRTSFANLHVRIFKKEANFLLLFEYDYMRSNLAHSGGYPTHGDVADMSNLFFFILSLLIEGDDTLTEFSPFEGKWVEQKSIQTRDEIYTNAYGPI